MKFSDLAVGLFLTCIGGGVLAYGFMLPPMTGQRYGAGLFPMLIGLCMLGFGASLFHQGWVERRATGASLITVDDWARDHRLVANMALVLILIIAYVLLAERVGFIPMSLFMLVVLFWRLGVDWRHNLVIAVLSTLFIQVLFSNVLRVPLPRGVLERLMWW